MPELPCLPRDTRRMTLLTDGRHEVRAGALDGERAGLYLLAFALRHRLRFAGEDRLVEREPVAAPEPAVRDHLIAAVEEHDVTLDYVFDTDSPRCAVADHACGRGDERGEAIECPLRTYFLGN